MSTIKINDVEIYYELHGEGAPVVLIAGFSCDHTFWARMLDELKSHFQILIFDNRGIGQTKDNGHAFTLESMADDTIALIQQLELKNPHIVGQSMGGIIAQLIARKYPKLINKQVILNSTPKINLVSLMVLESIINLIKVNVSIDLVLDVSLPWFYSSDFFAVPENISTLKSIILNNPFPQSLTDLERQYNALKTVDSRDWLHEIKTPTHIIVAENDIVTLPSESQLIKQKIPGATLATIPGGHSSPIERPEHVNQEILQFLGSI